MMRGSGAPEQKWASHAGAVEIGAGGGGTSLCGIKLKGI